MRRILIATDFSARADRAIRRSALLARQFDCDLIIAHVVDDDRAPSLVEVERREALTLLDKIAQGLRAFDGLRCEARLALGEPFDQIARLAQDEAADLLVIGPYRSDRLKNVFVGATAERIIRASRRPVLMANGPPTGPYERILMATDFTEASVHAGETARTLGLLEGAQLSVVHAYAAARPSLRVRSPAPMDDYPETHAALARLKAFTADVGVEAADEIAELITATAAEALRGVAGRVRAELVVIGASRRPPLAQAWLSSVGQDLLRFAETDILVVPSDAASEAA